MKLLRTLLLALLPILGLPPANAQSPLAAGRLDPGYAPRFERSNQPFFIHPYADGRLLLVLYSDAVRVSGVEARRLFRLKADGLPDPSFSGPAFPRNGYFRNVVPLPGGGVLVDEVPPYNGGADLPGSIVRLASDGSPDPTFQTPELPEGNQWWLLAVQPDQRILAVRVRTWRDPEPHQQLVRLQPDGSLDSSFVCAVNDGREFRRAVLLDDGRLVIEYGPADRVTSGTGAGWRWTRLHPDGSSDATYQPSDELINFDRDLVAVGADGSVYQERYRYDPEASSELRRYIRLGPDGQVDAGFQPEIVIFSSLGVTEDGHWRVVVQKSLNPAGTFAYSVVDLDVTGAVVNQLDLTAPTSLGAYVIVTQREDGELLVQGESPASGSGITRSPTVQRYSATGDFLGGYHVDATQATIPQAPVAFSDGSLVVSMRPPNNGADFDTVNRIPVSGPAWITPNGDLNGAITDLLKDQPRPWVRRSDGRILSYEGEAGLLVLLGQDGTLQPSFPPRGFLFDPRGMIQSDMSLVTVGMTITRRPPTPQIAQRRNVQCRGVFHYDSRVVDAGPHGTVLPDDRVLVWGHIEGVGGSRSSKLVRLGPDLLPDRHFDARLPADGWVQSVVVQPDGRIVVAYGPKDQGGGEVRWAELMRLEEDGSVDATFGSGVRFDGMATALAVDGQGRILVSGRFRQVGDRPCASLARILPDGAFDESFVRGGDGTDRPIEQLYVLPDDSVVAYGKFRFFDGAERWGLARVDGGVVVPGHPRVLATSVLRSAWTDERVVLGAVVTGREPRLYQWNFTGAPLPGETNQTLTVPAFSAVRAGSYQLRVSNPQGTTHAYPVGTLRCFPGLGSPC